MFPIYDIQKRIVGFGGRVFDNSTPKYLNSPETPVFTKGNLLYGLDAAKDGIVEAGYAIIVEGYMDVIAVQEAGICNVVGTLGTAFTPNHLRILQRLCKGVILTFDSDTAGINAALRTLDVFIGSEVEAKVILLPEGDDPDSFIRKNGKTAFLELIRNSTGIIDFAISRIINRKTKMDGVFTKETRLGNAEECLNIIRKIPNRIAQDIQLARVSKDLKIEKDVLYVELKRKSKGKKALQPEKNKENTVRHQGVEEILLTLIIKDKRIRKLAKENLDRRDFLNPVYQKIAAHILMSEKDLNDILNSADLEQDVHSEITRLALSDLQFELPEKHLFDYIRALQREKLNHELRKIEKELYTAEIGGTFEKVRNLLITKQGLLQKKKLLYEN